MQYRFSISPIFFNTIRPNEIIEYFASLWVLIIENGKFWLLIWRVTFPTILQVVFQLFHLISIISHFLSGQGLAIESGHSNISCRHSWRNPIARLLSVYNYLMDGRVINNISRRDHFNS